MPLDYELELRNKQIRKERKEGAKWAYLASKYNISEARIGQILKEKEDDE